MRFLDVFCTGNAARPDTAATRSNAYSENKYKRCPRRVSIKKAMERERENQDFGFSLLPDGCLALFAPPVSVR
jgi:hypothetical protein